MKSKRFFSMALVAMMAASIALTSCGDSGKGSSSSSGGNGDAPLFTYDGNSAPVINSDKPIKISWLAATSILDENKTQVMQAIQEAWGDKVEIEWELKDYSEYSESVGPRLNAGGDLPDVCWAPNGNDANGLYWKSGIFQDISEYYEKYGYNLKKKLDNDYPSAKERLIHEDGSMYYIPRFGMDKDYGINMMINGKWLDKLGLEAPKDTNELYNVLKAFKEKDPNGNGQADEIPLTFNPGYEVIFSTIYGFSLQDNFMQNEKGEWEVAWTSDLAKEYYTYMHKLYEEGLLDQSWSSGSDITTKVANDTVGMTEAWSWSASFEFSAAYDEYDGTKGIFDLLVPVKAPNGKQYYRGVDSLDGIYGITRNCEHPDLVFAMMDYLFQDDMVKLANMGIKGVDWDEDASGNITIDEALLNDETHANELGTNPRCVPFEQNVVGIDPQFPKWHQEENAVIRNYIEAPLIWTPVNDEDNAVYEQYYTDLNKYWWEEIAKFVAGVESLDNWDSYVQHCKDMGQDKLLEVFLHSQEAE